MPAPAFALRENERRQMKRSRPLIALSHDHHQALDVARLLRRATPAALPAALQRLHEYWEPAGRRHFDVEEQVLLDALPATDAAWRSAAEHVRREHDDIRARVEHVNDVSGAHELGTLLHDHVRFEERELFAMLVARLSEAELASLGDRLDVADA